MLHALDDSGISPDVVLGTSIGAINGAMFAAYPSADAVARLEYVWTSEVSRSVFGASAWQRMGTIAKSWTHTHPSGRCATC